jgi:Na+-driven multidrug efflux pump
MILTRAPHNALVIANQTNVIFAIDFLTLLLAIVLNLFLIPPFGIPGAAFASIISFGVGGAVKFLFGDVWRGFTLWNILVPRLSSLTGEERDIR